MREEPKHPRPSGLLPHRPCCPGYRWDELSYLAPGSLPSRLAILTLHRPLTSPTHTFYWGIPFWESHSRGIFTEWKYAKGKDFPTDYMSGALQKPIVFHGDSSRDHQRQAAEEDALILPKLWSGLYNPVPICASQPPHFPIATTSKT